MLLANTSEDTTVDDLVKLSPFEAAVKAQREYNLIYSEMEIAKDRREYSRERLIADLETRGTDRDGIDGVGSVKLTKSLKNKVTDKQALLEYVYSLDEPVETYLDEVFRRGNKSKGIPDPLDRLVKEAAMRALEESKSVEECMPPGLAVRSVSSIRITLNKGEKKKLTETEEIMAQLDAEVER